MYRTWFEIERYIAQTDLLDTTSEGRRGTKELLSKLDRNIGKALSEDKFQRSSKSQLLKVLQRSYNIDIVFSFKTKEVLSLSQFWLIKCIKNITAYL